MFSESRKQTNTYLTTEKINFQLKYARNTCQRKHSPQQPLKNKLDQAESLIHYTTAVNKSK